MKRIVIILLLLKLSNPLFSENQVSKEEIDRIRERMEELENNQNNQKTQSSDITAAQVTRSIELSDTPQTPEEKHLRTIYDEGFYLVGKDDTIKIGGWAQTDYRAFIGDHPSKNTFLIRRARLDIRGVLESDFAYRLYGAFESTSAKLQEAWLEYRKFSCARLRIGQFKEPFSLEALYSAKWIYFVERGLGPTNLAPSEDIGIQLFGELYGKQIVYAIAVFNGQGKNVIDADHGKDVAARATYQPFIGCPDFWLEGLYIGGSVTAGSVNSSVDSIRYRTAARTDFLTYAPGVVESGPHYRGDLEFEWLNGSFEFTSEYLASHRHKVKNDSVKDTVTSRSWYISAAYLLTGEEQPRNRPVVPKHDFDPCKGTWGAWEVGMRYEEFRTNSNPIDVGLVTGAKKVSAWTGGINWWSGSTAHPAAHGWHQSF
ncbi:MAG: Porin O [Chlamydiae bacterium]|nr:Porin O [Chlamydiota bacterium]